MTGITLNLASIADAEHLAQQMERAISDSAVDVIARAGELSDKHMLRIQHLYHSNIKISVIDTDFVHGPSVSASRQSRSSRRR